MAKFIAYSSNETRGNVSPKAPPTDPQIKNQGEYFTVSAYVNPSFTTEPCFFDYWEVKVNGTDMGRDSSPTINLLVEDDDEHTYIAHFITQSEVITSDIGLTFRLKNNQGDTYFDFGEIQAVEMDYSAKVTQKAIITFDYQNALCYDMGVSKTYSIDFIRVNPQNPDKNPNNTRNWSNADWIRGVKQLINRWQGQHNGFKLYLVPDNDNIEHFPMFIENVYVSGSLSHKKSMDTSPQAISGSISLAVGSLYGLMGQGQEEVRLYLDSAFPSAWGERQDSRTYIVSVGSRFTLSRVAEWDNIATKHKAVLVGFMTSDGTQHPIDTEITITDPDTHITAVWSQYIKLDIIEEPTTIVKEEDATVIEVWIIGAGGFGGEALIFGGGGGGGGEVWQYRFNSAIGDPWQIEITQIGQYLDKNTIATINGSQTIVAQGGEDGESGVYAQGGRGGNIHFSDGTIITNDGGNAETTGVIGAKGQNGQADGNGGGLGGENYKVDSTWVKVARGGGGGGGSCREIIEYLSSKGKYLVAGNGGTVSGHSAQFDGTYGCGGGGGQLGANITGGRGGNGCVIVIQY